MPRQGVVASISRDDLRTSCIAPMRRPDFIFQHRVRSWPEHDKALIARGSLTFWVDDARGRMHEDRIRQVQ
jgi:hypothetical protein